MSKFKVGDKVVLKKEVMSGTRFVGRGCEVRLFDTDIDNFNSVKYATVEVADTDGTSRVVFKLKDEARSTWCADEWLERYVNKPFSKKDLRSGDVVIQRNDNVQIAILEIGAFLTDTDGHNVFDIYNDDLTSTLRSEYDIIKVYRPNDAPECGFSKSRYGKGTLMYDESNLVVEMTLEEICEALGKNIKIVK